MKDFITEILEEFNKQFINPFGLNEELRIRKADWWTMKTQPHEVKAFLTTKLTEAIAQEREDFKKTLESLIEEIPDFIERDAYDLNGHELKQQLRAKYLAPPK